MLNDLILCYLIAIFSSVRLLSRCNIWYFILSWFPRCRFYSFCLFKCWCSNWLIQPANLFKCLWLMLCHQIYFLYPITRVTYHWNTLGCFLIPRWWELCLLEFHSLMIFQQTSPFTSMLSSIMVSWGGDNIVLSLRLKTNLPKTVRYFYLLIFALHNMLQWGYADMLDSVWAKPVHGDILSLRGLTSCNLSLRCCSGLGCVGVRSIALLYCCSLLPSFLFIRHTRYPALKVDRLILLIKTDRSIRI